MAGLATSISTEMAVRLYQPDDLPVLHAANQASVPGVSSESLDDLALWIELATCLVCTDDANQALGFTTIMPIGLSQYPSPNMRWFEDYAARTGTSIVYVDRIAFLPSARGKGLGQMLYEAAFAHFSDVDEIGCEVNTQPPNPGSHRFHQRLGFRQIGSQDFVPGEKSVEYYTRRLRD